MWATDAVRPYEGPMPSIVNGTVPIVDTTSYKVGKENLGKLTSDELNTKAELSYRRYCHHCHGQNGDGRIIVGESLKVRPADLRSSSIQSKTEEDLFNHIKSGGKLMLPLSATMTPQEILLSIQHIRKLRGRGSVPYVEPQYTEPIQ